MTKWVQARSCRLVFTPSDAEKKKLEHVWSGICKYKKAEATIEMSSQLRLFGQLSMVNDLLLIRFLCMCGNALYVATAWKKQASYGCASGGGFLCVQPR